MPYRPQPMWILKTNVTILLLCNININNNCNNMPRPPPAQAWGAVAVCQWPRPPRPLPRESGWACLLPKCPEHSMLTSCEPTLISWSNTLIRSCQIWKVTHWYCYLLTNTVWKFSRFPATLILCEINFGWFQRVKNYRFNNSEGIELWFSRKISHLKMSKVPKNSNFRTAQTVKIAVFWCFKMTKIDFT